MPGNIYAVADRFKRRLAQREEAAAREISGYYREAERRITRKLDKLVIELEQWQRENPDERPPAWWLFERERLQSLQSQVEGELKRFAGRATERVEQEQRWLVEHAEAHAEVLTRADMGAPPPGLTLNWAKLPRESLEQLVGTLEDGSPLRSLLDALGPAASATIRQELVAGMALGQNPRVVARHIRDALDGNRARAETIARSEMLRSYREATRRSYQANSHVVRGWVWHSALDARVCPACWAMHGSVHPLEERLDDHPRGRCQMLPQTRTWEELGFHGIPETGPRVETGEVLFARLPEGQQRAILGQAGYEAYQAGAVTLADYVGRKSDPRWGTMRYARSLREMLGAGEARKWYGRAVDARAAIPHSTHPTDVLIRDLIRSGLPASLAEVEQIRTRMAEAEFPTVGRHLRKRVAKELQWADSTTEAEYLADLRAAIQDSGARLAVYQRYGVHLAAVLTDTNRIVPPARQGAKPLPLFFVVFSADRGIILSGYQASALAKIGIPETVRWLR